MNKFYVAEDKDWNSADHGPGNFVVMEHLGSGAVAVVICRGNEENCKDVIRAMEFLYVTAAKELKDTMDTRWSDGSPSRIEQHRS